MHEQRPARLSAGSGSMTRVLPPGNEQGFPVEATACADAELSALVQETNAFRLSSVRWQQALGWGPCKKGGWRGRCSRAPRGPEGLSKNGELLQAGDGGAMLINPAGGQGGSDGKGQKNRPIAVVQTRGTGPELTASFSTTLIVHTT